MASKSVTFTKSCSVFLCLSLLLMNPVAGLPENEVPSCPRDSLKLGVCASLLSQLLHLDPGIPARAPCCSLIGGLLDLEAAVCLCTTIKANLLGINLDVPLKLTLLLNYCGKDTPQGFQCA